MALILSFVPDAANDCHAGLVLYERLAQMATNMARVPQRVWYSFDMISGLLPVLILIVYDVFCYSGICTSRRVKIGFTLHTTTVD